MTTHQWSMKSLVKQLVMSESYRQSSEVTEEKLELDPSHPKYVITVRGFGYRFG